MTKKELIEKMKDFDDSDELTFCIFDYEYDNEEPYENGSGKIVSTEKTKYGNYINIGLNYSED